MCSKTKAKVHRNSGTTLTLERRREVREREEVVKLPQLRRRVHWLLTASSGSAAGRRLPGGLAGLAASAAVAAALGEAGFWSGFFAPNSVVQATMSSSRRTCATASSSV